jgi:molybdopterin synthase sulfur carrier subunit
MKVNIKYFAGIRETLGTSHEERETSATSLTMLRDELIAQGGVYAESLARGKAVRMALNQVMCDESVTLTDRAEVAFFPPVTGG